MTCSLRVMMDKDFSRWDEIKIYMRCFCAQLVGRSSSFNSISAAGDGHPESGLSNGAVSWQNPPTHTHTRTHTHTHTLKCSDTLKKKVGAVGTSGARCHSWGWAMDAGRGPNHRKRENMGREKRVRVWKWKWSSQASPCLDYHYYLFACLSFFPKHECV